MSEFRNFDRIMNSRQRQFRIFTAVIVIFQIAIVVGAIYLLTHPRVVGHFFGELIVGATERPA